MLDQIDLDRAISKPDYKQQLPGLQARLYDLEQAVQMARLPVLVLFEGWAGTSKIGTIGLLTNRLDPRGLRVHPVTAPRTHERQYPWLYRFWLKTPSYGQIALFDRSWYREVLAAQVQSGGPPADWQAICDEITTFERQLSNDGAVLLKFWLHISKDEQKRRFSKLLNDPLTAWQVTREDRWQQRHYRQVLRAAEDLLARTDTPCAPWHVVPATDRRFAQIAVIEQIISTVSARLAQAATPATPPPPAIANNGGTRHATPAAPRPEPPGLLRRLDLTLQLEQKSYERELTRLQAQLHLLGLQVYQQLRPVVLVFEGWDAAGKGGAIKRLSEQLDPRAYVVHSIGAPSGEDREHHYLYRFWRRLAPSGQIAIFDRSWYGRVLVERIEGFATPDAWQRAYSEINEFERQLVRYGTIICKFWLHISPDEQLRRFQERQQVPYKAWKLTDEDWRNREKWPQYEQAADEMLQHTSTPAAPWTLVEAEDKRYARIKVLRTVAQRLEADLGKVKL